MAYGQKADEKLNSVPVVVCAIVVALALVWFGIFLKNGNLFIVEAVHEFVSEPAKEVPVVVEPVTSQSINQVVWQEATAAGGGPNYIYERTTEDTEAVAVLGEFEVNEEKLERLNKVLTGYSGKVGLKAVTIDGSKGVSYNSSETFFMASAVKAPYLLYSYMQMDAGNGSPGEEMKYTGNFYHKGTGLIRYMPVGTIFTLEEIMRYTMRKSDNVGYNMCIARWGKEGYNKLMTQYGCQSLVLEDWTPWVHEGRVDDLLIVWEEIYKFMNQGSEGARLMYDSCTYVGKTADYNIMKDVLPDTLVSQKYGWSDDGYGNGAVVYGENHTYILVVFMDSSGTAADQQVYREVVRLVDDLLDNK